MESCFLAFFTNILVVLYSIRQQDLGTATTARSRGQLLRSCPWNCQGLWYQLRDPCIHWGLGHSHCSQGYQGRWDHRHHGCWHHNCLGPKATTASGTTGVTSTITVATLQVLSLISQFRHLHEVQSTHLRCTEVSAVLCRETFVGSWMS